MGKKSKAKSKSGKAGGGGGGSTITPDLKENEIPLLRKYLPEIFQTLVDEINPIKRFDSAQTWVCVDDDSFFHFSLKPTMLDQDSSIATCKVVAERQKIRKHGAPAECPLCFRPAHNSCSRCNSVYYCGAECQKQHWKISHKKACQPIPDRYRFEVNMDEFRSLPDEAFEGHEFILIKPTEQLSTLAEICDVCLESADDILGVPGFGEKQIQAEWVMNNWSSPAAQAVKNHFGWTSPMYEVGVLEGYRPSEDHIVYMLMYDDNFLGEKAMAASYYGDACFSWARQGKHVRGNIVIFKFLIKNKKRVKREAPAGFRGFMMSCSDDDDLHHEWELYPSTKAEIAHMLRERRNAISLGKYTRRQWRCKIRAEERRVEGAKNGMITLPGL